jgi:hypothetical protein
VEQDIINLVEVHPQLNQNKHPILSKTKQGGHYFEKFMA